MSAVELSHGIVVLWIAEKGKLDVGTVERPWNMLLSESETVKHRRVLATCKKRSGAHINKSASVATKTLVTHRTQK